jgi:hypothetical protein
MFIGVHFPITSWTFLGGLVSLFSFKTFISLLQSTFQFSYPLDFEMIHNHYFLWCFYFWIFSKMEMRFDMIFNLNLVYKFIYNRNKLKHLQYLFFYWILARTSKYTTLVTEYPFVSLMLVNWNLSYYQWKCSSIILLY